eukprot:TRINITY_DN3505_c0_g1_i4.p1 TRINITY_DN3505_c0_g1~~TRINITY_DN3505_c0_g1_i4.p1  ORF type:complete len:248 (-),score=14.89 TRINITY_DN3505_c0_g1_i4:83-826(-)
MPILKVTTTKDFLGKRLDITIQDARHNGIKCVSVVHHFLSSYETLKPLLLVLKHLLSTISLNDTYKGGLNSYGLLLLIVAYLQMNYITTFPCNVRKIEGQVLGYILLEFLRFYGIEFDNQKFGVFASSEVEKENQAPIYFINPHEWQSFFSTGGKLLVVDPLNVSNNVGKGAFLFPYIKSAFVSAHNMALQRNVWIPYEALLEQEQQPQGTQSLFEDLESVKPELKGTVCLILSKMFEAPLHIMDRQ